MLKKLRVLALLCVLLVVAASQWLTRLRVTDWEEPLYVVVYPVNGDGSAASADYIAALDPRDFQPVAAFLAAEGERYGVALDELVVVHLAPRVDQSPPPPPEDRNPLLVGLWSLRLQWWAWRNDGYPGPEPDIRLFVQYFDPERHPRLAHSVGLSKALLGVVNAFASSRMAGSNLVILTHELLHTLGASDKYDPASSLPLYPTGYAEPDRQPRYPQRWAELMGGRIPRSPVEATIPESLDQVLIGPATATEIRWLPR